MPTLVIIIIKIVNDAGLRVGQVGKNGREYQKVWGSRGNYLLA